MERESRGRNGWAKARQLSKQALLASAQPQDGQQNKTQVGVEEEKAIRGREKDQDQNPPVITPTQSSDSLLKGAKEKNNTEGRAPPPTVLPRTRLLQRGTTIPSPPAPSRMSSVSSTRTPSLSSGAPSLSLGTPSLATSSSQSPRAPPPVPARKNFPSTAL